MTGYLGSKGGSGTFQNIIAIMPPHDTYIETHLGSGVVMKRKPPAITNIGIDLDPNSLEAFECDYPVELINTNSHQYLKNYKFTGNELLFCDPPYLAETRTSRHKYRYEYTDANHSKLLSILKKLSCKIILSGYPSTLYDKKLNDWNTVEYQSMTRGGIRTEKLWFNYELDSLYWSSYAGKDFTDRQRIKRKAERWKKNYERLPENEKIAILSALMEVEAR